MNKRIQRFLDLEDLTPSKFADIMGIQRSSVSHILAERNKPSFDFIEKMMIKFPNINAEWLILGKGKPYKENSPTVSSGTTNNILSSANNGSSSPVNRANSPSSNSGNFSQATGVNSPSSNSGNFSQATGANSPSSNNGNFSQATGVNSPSSNNGSSSLFDDIVPVSEAKMNKIGENERSYSNSAEMNTTDLFAQNIVNQDIISKNNQSYPHENPINDSMKEYDEDILASGRDIQRNNYRPSQAKRIVKITIFYNDGTYEDR